MITDHVVLLVFMLITLVMVVAGFTFLGWLLFESHRMVRDSQNLTRAVGSLVIQETNKIPGKSG